MNSFKMYAEKVNYIAMEAMKTAQKVQDDYTKAENDSFRFPQGITPADAKAQEEKLLAQNAYHEAKRAYLSWRQNEPGAIRDKLSAIRKDLEAEVDRHFSADPKDLDGAENTLTLLRSGILRAGELDRLFSDALAAGNYTLARLIASHAAERADKEAKSFGMNDERVRAFRTIANKGTRIGGDAYINNFDVLGDILIRAAKNPALFAKWEELTGEIIAKGF